MNPLTASPRPRPSFSRPSLPRLAAALILAGCALSAQADASRAPHPPLCASGQPAASPRDHDHHDEADRALSVAALTDDGRLVCFNEKQPRKARVIGAVNGLQVDTRLVGIDYRVQDGLLYGVGDAGGVYTLDTTSAVATLVNRIGPALEGTRFGVDFNPAADRLRIVSNTGQNLRHNVNAGGVTLTDGALNYTAGTPALGVVGAAYTNNDLSATTTATTLFVLDAALDQVALQSPPNAGSLVSTGKLTLDASALSGFDIHSSVRDGVTRGNRALVTTVGADGVAILHKLDLLTGKATPRGALPAGIVVIDIAVPLYQD